MLLSLRWSFKWRRSWNSASAPLIARQSPEEPVAAGLGGVEESAEDTRSGGLRGNKKRLVCGLGIRTSAPHLQWDTTAPDQVWP